MIDTWGKLRIEKNLVDENFNIMQINNYVKNRKKSEDDLKKIKASNDLQNLTQKETTNISFPISFILKSYIFKPKQPTKKKKLEFFSKLNDYLNQRMDLIYYLRTLYTIDITNS